MLLTLKVNQNKSFCITPTKGGVTDLVGYDKIKSYVLHTL